MKHSHITLIIILTALLATITIHRYIHTEKELSSLKTLIMKQQDIINEKTFHIQSLTNHLEALSITNDSLLTHIDQQKEKVVYIKEKEEIIKSQSKSDQELIISIQSHTK